MVRMGLWETQQQLQQQQNQQQRTCTLLGSNVVDLSDIWQTLMLIYVDLSVSPFLCQSSWIFSAQISAISGFNFETLESWSAGGYPSFKSKSKVYIRIGLLLFQKGLHFNIHTHTPECVLHS